MNDIRRFKKKSILALIIASLMVLLIWHKTGIYFETNDDKCITEILCGRMTGAPDVHTVYVSSLLALPLSLLYRLTGKIPWYGMFLILCQIFAYTAVLESVYSRCTKKLELAAGTALGALVLWMNLYLLGCIQYTSTAALLAAAGYFCLLVQDNRKRGWIYFCLSELLAGLLRINAMLMVQPMGIFIIAGALMSGHKLSFRERLAALGRVILPPAAVCLIILTVNAFAYGGSDWKAYLNFNDAEEILFDYKGLPPYQEVRDILDRYQVTEIDYNAYASYMILDWILPPECAQEVAEYAQKQEKALSVKELGEELARNLFEDSHWGLNSVLVVLWIAVAVMALLWKDLSIWIPALGLLAGKLFSWGFLLYQGRFPLRVSMPLLAGEILLLLALLLRYGKAAEARLQESCMNPEKSRKTGRINRKGLGYFALALFWLGVCGTGVLAGRQQYYYVLSVNKGQKIFMEGLRDIGAYCNAHPENKYILDAVSMGYYKGSALEYEIYQDRNYIVAGSWYSNSPELRRYQAEYLSEGEGFYFLVYDSDSGLTHPCVSYLIQETGVQPEVYDRITVSHGGTYLIYFFDGEYHIEEP